MVRARRLPARGPPDVFDDAHRVCSRDELQCPDALHARRHGPPVGHRPQLRPGGRDALKRLPAGIWALGFGSLFMDMSSELVHGLLPLFMVSVLHTSVLTVGIVEGVAEATAAILKVFSGAISDRFQHRKSLVVLGYGLSAATKPFFPLAGSVAMVFGARFLDRVGKGIRGAPRDALVADLVPESQRGAAYGLRQALDSVGAVLGPLLAVALMFWLADLRAAMWVAVVPAVIAVTLLATVIREPERAPAEERPPMALSNARLLPRAFWGVVALGGLFTLARFSEAFLVLRAEDVGVPLAWVPAVMVCMNVFYAGAAYPAGAAADSASPRSFLLAGLVLLVLGDLVLALAPSIPGVFVGTGLWGLHLALTQGLLSKLVADSAPPALRGTAFGVFNLVLGVALLLASGIAGALWSTWGPAATFGCGAVLAGLAAAIVLLRR
ncbi:MAG: MFS transporter [Alphaproteobacteria bacterium]|nr:MFS transporter [Alphaproteobacteria bacterium]